MKIRFRTGFTAALAVSFLAGVAAAEDSRATSRSANRLVSTAAQDEAGALPADNTAYFTAARKVKVKLDLLAAMQDEGSELANALVTVIRPNGQKENFSPDADGMITIENAEKGVHAVVASSDRVHGTMPLYFDEQGKTNAAVNAAPDSDPSPVQLTMLRISDTELRPAIDRVRNVEGSDMGRLADAGPIGDRYGYRVKLGADGTLFGRVILLGKNNTVSPGGVNITIYYKGDPVGTTTSDDLGNFRISGMMSGVHGLVASGRAGYAAFGFEAIEVSNVASVSANQETFVSFADGAADKLPVVLVPPELVPACVDAITGYYPSLNQPLGSDATAGLGEGMIGDPIGPVGSGFAPPPFSSAPFGGGGGGGFSSGGGGFGGGGIGGLAALGALGAAVYIATDDDDNTIVTPMQPASPTQPAN